MWLIPGSVTTWRDLGKSRPGAGGPHTPPAHPVPDVRLLHPSAAAEQTVQQPSQPTLGLFCTPRRMLCLKGQASGLRNRPRPPELTPPPLPIPLSANENSSAFLPNKQFKTKPRQRALPHGRAGRSQGRDSFLWVRKDKNNPEPWHFCSILFLKETAGTFPGLQSARLGRTPERPALRVGLSRRRPPRSLGNAQLGRRLGKAPGAWSSGCPRGFLQRPPAAAAGRRAGPGAFLLPAGLPTPLQEDNGPAGRAGQPTPHVWPLLSTYHIRSGA